MKPNQAKDLVKYNLKIQQPPVHLTEQNLDTIEKVYGEIVSDSIFRVALYRFFNFSIALVWIVIFALTTETKFAKWSFVLLTGAFLLINFFFAVFGFVKYYKAVKRLKND